MQSDVEKTEEYLKESFRKVNELSEILQLPTLIRQNAKDILRHFEKKRPKSIFFLFRFAYGLDMKGLRKDSFIIAVLLLASKQEQGGRTLKGFSRATNVEEKEIKKFYKILRDRYIKEYTVTLTRKSVEDEVKELVEVFCNKIQQPFHVIKEAKEVAGKAIGFLEGKRPSSIAAAAILFVFTVHAIPHRQQDLATVAGISTNTLRNVIKELNKHIDHIPNHLFQIKSTVQIAC